MMMKRMPPHFFPLGPLGRDASSDDREKACAVPAGFGLFCFGFSGLRYIARKPDGGIPWTMRRSS
jgi:hypothetical protein